jgi:hypothetical protein
LANLIFFSRIDKSAYDIGSCPALCDILNGNMPLREQIIFKVLQCAGFLIAHNGDAPNTYSNN